MRYRRGSTPKLTYELIERIAASYMAGDSVEKITRDAKIGKTTFYRWVMAGNSKLFPPNKQLRTLKERMK